MTRLGPAWRAMAENAADLQLYVHAREASRTLRASVVEIPACFGVCWKDHGSALERASMSALVNEVHEHSSRQFMTMCWQRGLGSVVVGKGVRLT